MSGGLDDLINIYTLKFTDNNGNPNGAEIGGLDAKILNVANYFKAIMENEPGNNILYLRASIATPEEFRHFYKLMEFYYEYPNFYSNLEMGKKINMQLPTPYREYIYMSLEDRYIRRCDRKGNPTEVAEIFADWFDRMVNFHLDEREILANRECKRRADPFRAIDFDERDYTPINMTPEDVKMAEMELYNINRFLGIANFLSNETLIKLIVRFFSILHGYFDVVRYEFIIRDKYKINLEKLYEEKN